MSEGDRLEPVSDAAVAFERMRRQLALLDSAVAGFAARQEEIAARDYAPDLARIIERQDKIGTALRTLADRPALALTPEAFGRDIAKAGASVRDADHRAMHASSARLDQVIGRIDSVVESALSADRQNVWMVWATTAGMVFGMLMWSFLPGSIARAMPEGWHWPEWMAARTLASDGWNAGERLLGIADAERWRTMVAAQGLVTRNAAALKACERRRNRATAKIVCRIEI